MVQRRKVVSCTSIEQSRKLVELGLDPDTCDMTWHKIDKNLHDAANITVEGWKFSKEGQIQNIIPNNCIPAWSLTHLLNLIPAVISYKDEEVNFCMCYDNENQPCANYSKAGKEKIKFSGENFLDAVFGLMCWLLEKAYIK